MRLWLAVAALASAGAGLVACQSSSFACQSDGACPSGRCEPQGWCSFPDESCSSGFRFGEHAALGLAGTCVEAGADETEASTAGMPMPMLTTTTGTTSVSTLTDPGGSGTTRSTTGSETSDGSTSEASGSSSTGPASTVVVTVPIAEDADDGSIFANPKGELVWAPSGEDGVGNGFFGEYPDDEYYVGYFRFELPDEADTGRLIEARLRLHATPQVTYMWGNTHAVGIWLESSADAPAVTGSDSFPWQLGGPPSIGVTLLETMVRWPEFGPLAWAPDTNISPDLTPLVELLFDESGSLSAGDHVQFWLAVAMPTGVGGEVTYVDYSNPAPAPTELELTFERR